MKIQSDRRRKFKLKRTSQIFKKCKENSNGSIWINLIRMTKRKNIEKIKEMKQKKLGWSHYIIGIEMQLISMISKLSIENEVDHLEKLTRIK